MGERSRHGEQQHLHSRVARWIRALPMEAIRSERKMDFTKVGETFDNPDIGPGSDDLTVSRNIKPAASAFSSSEPRHCDAGTAKFITPGPGSYVRSESKLALGGFASSTFASNTKRFKPKPCDGNPAPGDYNAPGGMASKALKLAERAGDAEPMVQWNRMQTAPSIPSKHQSYGFRKSADRGIVPLKSRDGAKSRVDEAPTQKKYKGVDWSKNKT